MKFDISHQIWWRYDRPVFLEPMTIRLRPRCDGSLQLLDWRLTFQTQPAGTCHGLDAFNNAVSLVWFGEQHDTLALTASSSVETSRENPFDYLLTGEDAPNLHLHYDDDLRNWLLPYRHRACLDGRIERWAVDLSAASGGTQAFLSLLTETMFNDFDRENREDGSAFTPARTFESRCGACRDLAVLFIDACRAVGIASRFVSGYVYEPDREGSSDLHAWAEVYLPGAGWRGYDPSLGLAVADRHIPLAAAPEPNAAAPTTGTFRGTAANSMIEYQIDVQTSNNH